MNEKSIETASDLILHHSLAAMRRAALRARDVALRTHTELIIFRDGQVVRVSPEEQSTLAPLDVQPPSP